jgi:hypothetical protein
MNSCSRAGQMASRQASLSHPLRAGGRHENWSNWRGWTFIQPRPPVHPYRTSEERILRREFYGPVAVTLLHLGQILASRVGVILIIGPTERYLAAPEETIVNRRIAMVVALILVAVALAGVVGTTAYRAGLARGLADAGNVPGPWLYHGPFWYPGPFTFLFPLLGLLLILVLVRGLFWRGWCASGPWKSGVPPVFEEWHRRAHESPPPGESVR